MKYNLLGNTGISVSEIGLGCEGFLEKSAEFTRDVFSLALDSGVNCMDLYSPDPDMHVRVGACIKDVRKNFVLQGHLCTVWKDGQYMATRHLPTVKGSFERMLKNLGTDYVDVGMIHYVDSDETYDRVVNGGILDYAKELKRRGVIRAIGMSSHNPKVALRAVNDGIEALMFSVNPCYDLLPADEDVDKLFDEESYNKPLLNMDPDRAKLYETCAEKGAGITVMKAFGGGDLLTENSPAGAALTVAQCIHYALTRPACASVMVGAHSKEQLRGALGYESAGDDERDFAAALARFPKMNWHGHCMYCGHCAPCPKGISVAEVTKFLNLALAQGKVPETVREHYAALKHKAGECIACGACSRRCPFGVDAVANMKKAKEVFGR